MDILNEKQKQILEDLDIGTAFECIKNPFSGQSCILEPTAVSLYDYIKGCEIFGDYENMSEAIMLFRINWPNEYYILLD